MQKHSAMFRIGLPQFLNIHSFPFLCTPFSADFRRQEKYCSRKYHCKFDYTDINRAHLMLSLEKNILQRFFLKEWLLPCSLTLLMAKAVCFITHSLRSYSVSAQTPYMDSWERNIKFSPSFREEEIHIKPDRYSDQLFSAWFGKLSLRYFIS